MQVSVRDFSFILVFDDAKVGLLKLVKDLLQEFLLSMEE